MYASIGKMLDLKGFDNMIAIIDYDAGNLKSVEKALVSLGEEVLVSRDSSEILQADKVILPGVGSFGDAMNNLDKFGLVDTIKKVTGNGTPFLGICLGLQLLFKESDEIGTVYYSDTFGYENQLDIIEKLPNSLTGDVIYPIAALKGDSTTSDELEAAKEFIAYLQTDEAMSVFEKYHFSVNK